MKKKWSTEVAMAEITTKWGGRISVPDSFTFKNVDAREIFICSTHGEFAKSVYGVLNSKYPCPKCSPTGPKGWEFIKAKLIHKHGERYDYSLNDIEYTSRAKLKIVCKTHGVFEQSLGDHLAGNNCPRCVKEESEVTVNDFLFESIKHHGNTYGYNYVFEDYTKANSVVRIVCKKHGVFTQRAGDHRKGVGCPNCTGSRGETAIRSFLLRNGIEFIFQKTYPDLKSERGWLYRYDFFLPKFNTLVEYDGSQHHTEGYLNDYDLTSVVQTDSIKTQYAERNSIRLIRISSLVSIETVLEEFVK